MICLLLFLILLTLFVLYLLQEERICNEIQNIPGPPLVPHFKSENEIDLYLKDALSNVRKLKKEYGSVVRLCMGSEVIVLLTEPKYIEQLLISEINCKEDFYKSILTAGKINKWLRSSKIGLLLPKLESTSKINPIHVLKLNNSVDSQFLFYFKRALSSKVVPHTDMQMNKTAFTSCLFKANKILKTKLLHKLAEKIPKEETVQTNSLIKFLVSSALIILANDPGVQEETFKEIAQIFGTKGDVEIKFENVRKMVHMERVLKEIIHPYTSVPFTVKTLTKKIKFGNTSVPAGVKIVIFTSGDSPTYPEPSDLNGNIEKQTPPNSPLIIKPTSCVGQKYIILRAKVMLTKLIRKFELLPTQEENGLPFKLKPRDTNVIKTQKIPNFHKP